MPTVKQQPDDDDIESTYNPLREPLSQSVVPDTQQSQVQIKTASTPTPTKKRTRSTLDNFVESPSKILRRDNTDYHHGAIVHVKLHNFVTYDSVEFSPGPNLNMIIGPNGTGKSTIVCAIALGLGFQTSVLGRAKDISEFVKTGHEEGYTKVELFNAKGPANFVVERRIRSRDNTSKWLINGQDSSHREVKDLMESLHIQVDNLCQFLPQDKVAEFAQLSKPELLKETQKAAAGKELVTWHNKLIDLRSSEKSLETEVDTTQNDLSHVQSRLDRLSRDVDQFNRREAALRRVRLVEAMIPNAVYAVAREEFMQLKAQKQQAVQEYKAIEEENQPVQDAKHELEFQKAKADDSMKKLTAESTKKLQAFSRHKTAFEKQQEEIDAKKEAIKAAKATDKKRLQSLQQVTDKITALEQKLEEGPPDVDLKPIQAAMQENTRRAGIIMDEDIIAVQNEQTEYLEQKQEEQQRLRQVQDDLRSFDDARKRKLNMLRQTDPNAYATYHELREQQERFEKPVYGPVWLEVDLKDQRYAQAFENAVPYSFRKNFVCQTLNDYRTFQKLFNHKQGIGYCHVEGDVLSEFRPPCSHQQMRSLGFDTFLSDVVVAPEPVLIELCRAARIHDIPVALGEVDGTQVLESRLFRRSYVAGQQISRINQSVHGSRLMSSAVNIMKPVQLMKSTADPTLVENKKREHDRIEKLLSDFDEDLRPLKTREHDLRDEYEELKRERNSLVEKRRELEGLQRSYKQAEIQLDTAKRDKGDLEARANEFEETKATITEDLQQLVIKRAQTAVSMQAAYDDMIQVFTKKSEAQLSQIQCTSDAVAFESFFREYTQKLRAAGEAVSDIDERLKTKKAEASELLQRASETMDTLEDDEKEELQRFGIDRWNPQQLQDEATRCRSEADLVIAPMAGVIDEYRTKQQAADTLSAHLADEKAQLEEVRSLSTSIYEQWRPRLDEIIKVISEKFSESFEGIGCSGEVQLNTANDSKEYALWGIEILVKFRDNEEMKALTGQRQSGGERSVSTIMYLMALQTLAKAPFRVVDEINQGMDPRNERCVHGQLVRTACDSNTSQYFLITPKLLPDLTYHERMKVLCINNGEWLPSETRRIKLSKYVQQAKAAKASGETWVQTLITSGA